LVVLVRDPGGERDRDHDRACLDVAGLVGDRDAPQVGQHLLVAAVERVGGGYEGIFYWLAGSGCSAIHRNTFRMIWAWRRRSACPAGPSNWTNSMRTSSGASPE
jgi:hypothetical protein